MCWEAGGYSMNTTFLYSKFCSINLFASFSHFLILCLSAVHLYNIALVLLLWYLCCLRISNTVPFCYALYGLFLRFIFRYNF